MAGMFARQPDGSLVASLPVVFAEVLVAFLDDLAGFIATPPPGEVADRLFPRAYLDPTEEESEREWQSAVHDDLAREKAEGARAVIGDLQGAARREGFAEAVLTGEEAEHRWLTVINDARLTLGTTLGVTDDEDLRFAADDPRRAALDLYGALTELQGDLVETLLAEMPEAGAGDDGAF